MAAKKKAAPAEATEEKAVAAELVTETKETAAEAAVEEKPKAKATEHTFTKSQLVGSKKYAGKRDVLKSQLRDGEAYTFAQVDAIIDGFMKKPVGKEGSED